MASLDSIVKSRIVKSFRRDKPHITTIHYEYWNIEQQKFISLCRSRYTMATVVEGYEVDCERCLNFL